MITKPRGVTARCVDGPYAGQTFMIPRSVLLKIHWGTWEYFNEGRGGRRFPVSEAELPISPLVWIHYGGDRHCYSLVANGHYAGWRLVYRDTF